MATASELLKPGQAVRVSVLFRQTDPQAKVRGCGRESGRAGGQGCRVRTSDCVQQTLEWSYCCATRQSALPPSLQKLKSPTSPPCLPSLLPRWWCPSSTVPPRINLPFLPATLSPQVVVSLKRMEDDPLKETLDNVLPLNGVR